MKNKRKGTVQKKKGKMNLVEKIGKRLLHYLFFILNINGLI
jgi:ribosomal protein S6